LLETLKENDCRKEPQKLQKEGSEEEDVSCLSCPSFLKFGHKLSSQSALVDLVAELALGRCHFFEKILNCCDLALTPSPRRNGTTSTSPPFLTSELPPSPPATELLVRVSIFPEDFFGV